MGRIFRVTLALVTAAGLAGCGSSQINRIDSNRDLYESWPLDVRQAVLDGKVEVGMTPDMVRVAWGKPTEVLARSNTSGDEEIWVYRKGGDDGTMMMPAGGIGGGMGGIGMGTGSGIGISTGRGGTGIYSTGGIGIGGGGVYGTPGVGMGGIGSGIGGMGGIGGTVPVMVGRPTPAEEKEVVFRNGVVYRADQP